TWDADEKQRQKEGVEKWDRAGEAFVKSKMVNIYVSDAESKWRSAITDGDGCLTMIAAAWREVTTADKKQDQLEKQINEVYSRLLQIGRGWKVDPDSNVERQQREQLAKRVLDWLLSDKQAVYERVQALEQTLTLQEGDQWGLSDFADIPTRTGVGRPDPMDRRFPKQLQNFLHEWATVTAPQKWEEYTSEHPDGGPWLSSEDIGALTRYMRDYFCSKTVFEDMNGSLLKVVSLNLKDEAALRRARRKYTQILFSDFVTNPGPSNEPLEEAEVEDAEEYGLMKNFVTRWKSRLPAVLASGAGSEIHIPPGNDELNEVMEEYDNQ
ncbi:MAG: virulence factor SrfC family protein, partial [Planctomycetales bacterium]